MKKRILAFILFLTTLLCLCSCSKENKDSTFSIRFIDVGQGDSALVECDGHYMLIDGGDENAGDKVYDVLEEQGIQQLDILTISHFHKDHYGGLIKALRYASKIGITISNSDYLDDKKFKELEAELGTNGSKITVPALGDKYELGSATVEVIDTSSEEANDSLVLLITYGKTRFLFTGDIERKGQLRVVEYFEKDRDKQDEWVSLIKMPHHGAYNDNSGLPENALYRLLWEYNPSYFVISVGLNNQYGHPHKKTMDIIENMVVDVKELNWNEHVYRTDKQGDIIVKSNGKGIFVEPAK